MLSWHEAVRFSDCYRTQNGAPLKDSRALPATQGLRHCLQAQHPWMQRKVIAYFRVSGKCLLLPPGTAGCQQESCTSTRRSHAPAPAAPGALFTVKQRLGWESRFVEDLRFHVSNASCTFPNRQLQVGRSRMEAAPQCRVCHQNKGC